MRVIPALVRSPLIVIGFVIAGASGGADVMLYDASGKAAASLDGQGQLWSNDSRVLGTIKGSPSGPAAVYSNEGKQVGWFKSGAFHDMDGLAVWAVSGRHMLVTEIPPIAPVKEIAPVAPIPEVAGVAPILRNEFAASPGPLPLAGKAAQSVEAQFKPSSAGQDLITNSFAIADGFASLREREQATGHAAESHARTMAREVFEITELKKQIEVRRREVEAQEALLAQSAADQAEQIATLSEKVRRLKRSAGFRDVVWAEPSGPMLAVQSIPELGLKKGDLFRTEGADENDAVKCTVQDFSLEGQIERMDKPFAWGSSITRSVEPIEIIADRIQSGKLRKLTNIEYESLLKKSDERLAKFFEVRVKLGGISYFVVTADIADTELKKGMRLMFREFQRDGTLFMLQIEGGREVALPAVPLETVMQSLDDGSIIEKSLL